MPILLVIVMTTGVAEGLHAVIPVLMEQVSVGELTGKSSEK
jgi:hypothetical protein